MSTENEKQSLDDAIERLEAEHKRRIDEKIERGEAIRAEWPIIVGVPDPEKDYDAVCRDADGREVYPAEPYSVIVTGVPRRGRDVFIDAPLHEKQPRLPPTVPASKPMPEPAVEREPLEWKPIRTQVSPPDERSCGIDIEGAYAVCGDQLHVRDHEDRSWTVALKPGDNAEVLAQKLLREKFGRHHAFNQPIH
jgi:hypothetical protein